MTWILAMLVVAQIVKADHESHYPCDTPWFAKEPWWVGWLVIMFLALLTVGYRLLRGD
jgi:hypothetical protein